MTKNAQRNWRELDRKYIQRGGIIALISKKCIRDWNKEIEEMNRGKNGGQYRYPKSLILLCALLHIIWRMPYRVIEGYLRAWFECEGIELPVPDHTQISRRVNALADEIPLPPKHTEGGIWVAIDSTGIKVADRGEWMREKWHRRRGWIKLNMAVDIESKMIMSSAVTDERVGDTKKFEEVLVNADKKARKHGTKVERGFGDGAFDSNECYKIALELGIMPVIKPRNNPPSARSKNPRKRFVKEYFELGYDQWRDKYRYGMRWMVESVYSAIKRITGEYVRARKAENMFHEVELKVLVYNLLVYYDHTGMLPW
jgi:hypothetical protein